MYITSVYSINVYSINEQKFYMESNRNFLGLKFLAELGKNPPDSPEKLQLNVK